MWIAERVGKRDRPESLGQPEGRGDHRFGAVRCPDSRCVSFRGNHQPGPVAGSGPGRGNAAGVLPRHSGSRCRGMRLHIGSANRRKAAPPNWCRVVDRCCTYGCRRWTDTPARRSWTIPAAMARDNTRRSKSSARRPTVMVALVGGDERAVLWQKLLTRASFSPTIRPRSSA